MALAIKHAETITCQDNTPETRKTPQEEITLVSSEEEILREGYVHYWLSHNNDLESIEASAKVE